jgi:hypothetical protein
MMHKTSLTAHLSRRTARFVPNVDESSIETRSLSLLFLIILLLGHQSAILARSKANADGRTRRIAEIVNGLRIRLQISAPVQVSVVSGNKRMVSIERSPKGFPGFLLSFDEEFLETLDDDDISAASAHELGHVWIYTHHPYLHTEALANEIAMRVVTREQLKKLYTKMWAHTGTGGNLEDLFPPDPAD